MYPKEKKIKNFIALVGVASAGAFLGFPALALISSSGSGSNQSLNNYAQAESTVTTRKLLAQGMPGDQTSPTPIPETTTSPTPASRAQRYPTSGPLEPGTWLCLNNPNPACRG